MTLECIRQMRVLDRIFIRVLVAFLALSTTGCSDVLCGRVEERRFASPDGEVDAVVSYLDCGATTSLVHDVSVVSKGMVPSDGDQIMIIAKARRIDANWYSNSSFEVSYEAREVEVLKQRTSVTIGNGELRSIAVSIRPL